ncbi:MAG: stage II sporulation protein M [Chloroflexota bacterium]
MRLVHNSLRIIGEHRRAYIVLNVGYYGLVVCGMIYVTFNPALQQSLIDAVGAAFAKGPLSEVVRAYTGGQVLSAMFMTFVVNLTMGSLFYITLPSLMVPFSGLLLGAYRAILWGLLLSPASPELRLAMIPHSLTLLLEGQAYILAIFAAYVHGRAFLWPHTVGEATRWQGYLAGVRRMTRLYLLVVIMLAVAAIYEALEVIFIVAPMASAAH